eukprot:CAMPEP_0174831582 /NCGR_PEP_ID=MMETSP1114-20130205/3176_1 /TAXON_ID=312471 /ORGANISM="Neobodo designis, Strain CCAP 1951/1" /LENGTH=388 /DNA_ID=CAMNT_0016065409 /DNA_START=122 /DNA_END=1288 /DNA_ORIENTATION=+
MAFGHHEGSYQETQMRMREAAEFSFAEPEADFISIPTLPVPAERCVFRRADQGVVDAGIFYEPALGELRAEVAALLERPDVKAALASFGSQPEVELRPKWSHVAGDALTLHQMSDARGAVFQAASQFNYLEFASPEATPEQGITCYAYDHTQGPACAMACPAGAAYRNYLIQPSPGWELPHGQRGQHTLHQRNSLEGVGEELLLAAPQLEQLPWRVTHGYTFADDVDRLKAARDILSDPAVRERLMARLRVGVQQDTDVLHCDHKVTQVFSSAVSVAYSGLPASAWEPLATLVLDATYEATLLVGVKNTLRHLVRHPAGAAVAALPAVNLTQVGAGVFGNRLTWIAQAMGKAHGNVAALGVPLNVVVVHFRRVDPWMEKRTAEFAGER